MALTKDEEAAISNVIRRLKAPRCGCAEPFPVDGFPARECLAPGYEGVSRVYLETWVIPALELLLPGPGRDPALARDLSGR
jgi:hypothetical protein